MKKPLIVTIWDVPLESASTPTCKFGETVVDATLVSGGDLKPVHVPEPLPSSDMLLRLLAWHAAAPADATRTLVHCRVIAQTTTATVACLSPNTTDAGPVSIEVSLNAQDYSLMGGEFCFFNITSPSVTPSEGPDFGGTRLLTKALGLVPHGCHAVTTQRPLERWGLERWGLAARPVRMHRRVYASCARSACSACPHALLSPGLLSPALLLPECSDGTTCSSPLAWQGRRR